MRYRHVPIFLLAVSLAGSAGLFADPIEVKTGLDVLLQERTDLIENKRIAVIANHTSVTASGVWILDALTKIKGLDVAILFTPEHGLDMLDEETRERWKSIQCDDLHAGSKKPDADLIAGLDAILYDVQDTGCRFYTYISTMLLAMDASKEAGVDFIVLDRPDPLGGLVVEGPILRDEFRSFVGMYPIPVRYGLTPGELAKMANGENYLPSGGSAPLRVIEMMNWKRSMYYDDTGLRWIPPSPNIPDLESALLYPGLCLLEGTNLSEGRGTTIPFRLVGAPWLSGAELIGQLRCEEYRGISLAETTYTPTPIPGKSEHPKFSGTDLGGLRMRVTGRDVSRPFSFGAVLVRVVAAMKHSEFAWTGNNYIDRLTGTDELRKAVDSGSDIEGLLRKWEHEAAEFARKSRPYYLYGE